MPSKGNPKYNLDRRRTRRGVERSATEASDSESRSPVPSENEEEYNPEDNEEDEVECERPRRRHTPQRRARGLNRKRGHGQEFTANTNGDDESSDDYFSDEGVGLARRSARVRLRKKSGTTRSRAGTTNPSSSKSEDEDEYEDGLHLQEDEKKAEATRNTPRNTRSSANRSDRSSSTRHRQNQRGGRDGGILANLSCPPSTSSRYSNVKARRRLTEMSKEETRHDLSEEDGDEDIDNDDDGSFPAESGSGNREDSDYDDEEEITTGEMLQSRSKAKLRRDDNQIETNKTKRKKSADSSDEEFVLDSDDDGDDSLKDLSSNDDASTKLIEDDNDISMIGDPDLSDDDSDDDVVMVKRKGMRHSSTNAVNVDDQNFGTIDDESDSDVPSNKKDFSKGTVSTSKSEIFPSTRGIENGFESNDRSEGDTGEDTGEERSKMSSRFRRKEMCPKCPSTEDAITVEPLQKLHVCYNAPDGKSRLCFNLETLRQIALKSSQLELRVDVDAERQNFLQPPAFRTAMSDDLVDQIASKFGRGALDLQGAYYKNKTKHDRKNDDEFSYDSNSSGNENIYDSFEAFRDRVKSYFRNGMGSQDLYVCPLCYGKIHRSIATSLNAADHNSDSDGDDTDAAIKEYDAAPSDSIHDPIMVLGHLDNEDMYIASQFCFKRLVDVKKHLRQEHNVDTGGIQGNELYQRFRVRAPDGLLQRWLSTQVRGQVKQGHMRMYWGQGHDQIFIQLLDLIERVKAYTDGSMQLDDDSSEEYCAGDEMNEYAKKAQEFFDTFATKAPQWWKLISSPFLKSNDNMNDFIAKDDDYSEEEGSDGQQHAAIHQHLMNEDSDENDLVHKLKRKYAEANDEETASRGSSTEEELEFVDDYEKVDADDKDEDEDEDVFNRNGYYSPIEEEKDGWILERQNQRKRRVSSVKKKEKSTNTEMKTPIGKKLFRRKTTPSSSTIGVSKKKRTLTLEDSSDDDSF